MSQPDESNGETLEQFRSYLYLLACTKLNHPAPGPIEASDLVQQTMLDGYAHRDQFRGDNDAQKAAWLGRILDNNLADAVRRQHRAKRDVSRQQSLDALVDGSSYRGENWLADSSASPSEKASKQEELLRLAEAIAELPEPQRQAVILHHLQGAPLAEVARQLGRTEAAVAGLLYRGLNKLHQRLDEGV